MTRRFWDSHDLRTLRALYPHLTVTELQPILRRPVTSIYQKANLLRLRKHAEYWTRQRQIQRARALTDPRLISGRFQPGQVPPNKGKPMSAEARVKASRTWFKPGSRPQTWKPVGTYRVNSDGYCDQKISDTGYPPRDWVGVHRLVWRAAHGPVPAGHVVVFKPGRFTTDHRRITVDALECITQRELMARNTLHNLPDPLRKLVQLRGALNRQINRKTKAQEGRP